MVIQESLSWLEKYLLFLISSYIYFVGGQTVSGAFSFRFGDDAQSEYGSKKLAELRENLSELKLIIIDEMSLISSDMFYKLDTKLKEIFHEKKKTPFGGIGMSIID